jgi:hypothetical protein
MTPNDKKNCAACNKAFNFFIVHKYPCLACGRNFCYSCVGNFIILQDADLVPPATMTAIKDPRKAQRCCNECFERINHEKQHHEHSHTKKSKLITAEERYLFGKTLGEGGFGIVKECISNEDGRRVAIKIINRGQLEPDDVVAIHNEEHILGKLHHPNIVQMFDFLEEKDNFYMVLECIDGGELFDRIVKKTVYTEKEARDLTMILLKAIKFMHDRNVVHR